MRGMVRTNDSEIVDVRWTSNQSPRRLNQARAWLPREAPAEQEGHIEVG